MKKNEFNFFNELVVDWILLNVEGLKNYVPIAKYLSKFKLGRIDLYYLREKKATDNISINQFLKKCQQEITKKKARITMNKDQANILTIGNRKNPNYLRIYSEEKMKGIKFELEIKKLSLKSMQELLVSGEIQQFEEKIYFVFLKHLAKILPLSYCYLDWLAVWLRKLNE